MTSEKYQEDKTRQKEDGRRRTILSWIFSGSYVNYYSLAPFVCVLGVFLVCLRVCVLSCFDVVVFVVV